MKNNPFIKRTIVILLLINYFFAANGFAVEKQFCCGKLTSINISLGNESKCPMCSKNKNCKKGCCNSKFIFQKINDSQKKSELLKSNQTKFDILVFLIPEYFQNNIENASVENIITFTIPPLLPHESVFIVNRSIRI